MIKIVLRMKDPLLCKNSGSQQGSLVGYQLG